MHAVWRRQRAVGRRQAFKVAKAKGTLGIYVPAWTKGRRALVLWLLCRKARWRAIRNFSNLLLEFPLRPAPTDGWNDRNSTYNAMKSLEQRDDRAQTGFVWDIKILSGRLKKLYGSRKRSSCLEQVLNAARPVSVLWPGAGASNSDNQRSSYNSRRLVYSLLLPSSGDDVLLDNGMYFGVADLQNNPDDRYGQIYCLITTKLRAAPNRPKLF